MQDYIKGMIINAVGYNYDTLNADPNQTAFGLALQQEQTNIRIAYFLKINEEAIKNILECAWIVTTYLIPDKRTFIDNNPISDLHYFIFRYIAVYMLYNTLTDIVELFLFVILCNKCMRTYISWYNSINVFKPCSVFVLLSPRRKVPMLLPYELVYGILAVNPLMVAGHGINIDDIEFGPGNIIPGKAEANNALSFYQVPDITNGAQSIRGLTANSACCSILLKRLLLIPVRPRITSTSPCEYIWSGILIFTSMSPHILFPIREPS